MMSAGLNPARLQSPAPVAGIVQRARRSQFLSPEVWSSLYLACANFQLRRQIINAPVKVVGAGNRDEALCPPQTRATIEFVE